MGIPGCLANVLGVEKVGIYDNFFELGGHSLLATQVISRLRSAFNLDISLRCLFESPTVAELEKFIEPSVDHKSAQIAPPIVPCQNLTEFPLSFAQARLWFLNELEGASATYNMPFGVHIQGNLNVNALTEAIQEIVNRHSILRTNFQVINGSTTQIINPNVTIPLSVINAENLPADTAEFRRLATLESQKPFDLTNDCLIRGTLWQFSTAEHLLLLTIHHIVSDGWSMAIFMQELSTLYQSFTQGLPSPLPELPLQYADYAVWQRNWFTSEVLATQQNYWKQQLADAPQLLKLPTERPRPAVQTFQGAIVELEINSQVAQQLKTLSQQSGATLYMTLLTAFATLLSRYSGQDDILIGSPIANRHHQATESLIGFFVNTLVMRTKLLGNPTFLELLKQVRQVTLDAYVHQDIPFEQVVEALQPERSLSYTPLFQVMFDLQQEPISWELPGLSLKSVEKEHKVAKFDLTLEVVQTAEGFRLKWEYNSDLFNRETISRMSNNFQTLLAAIIANPHQPVKQLTLLTTAEQHQLLVEWNNTQLSYPQNASLPDLFAKQVLQTPDNIAVEFVGQKLTYRELDEQANQLANYLQSLGVGTENLVGLCVERSPLMIVGLLGILKAGAAYLPLDPSYPQERLAFMLSDSQASVLLTQEKLVSSLPKHNLHHCICLDKDWKEIAQQSATTPISNLKPDNLAYVIYTSGSTGKPKGVMIEHQSIVNFAISAQNKYKITSSDKVLQFAPVSFDVAAEEIYPCLTTGGTVVLRTDEMLLSASRFFQRCQEWQLTVIDLPTSYWHQLILELAKTKETLPESLRLVIIGGEPALPETLKLWQTCVQPLGNPPQLLNAYGPTETTVEATCCDLSEYMKKHPTATSVPIGSPLNNVTTYILDNYLQPVPIGVAGELHIGGDGLARGYLGRPDVTTLKFIANPFSNQPEARLYKTGDLVRYLPDGKIEYLGRIDNQVKIRGFRIEIGEIEAAIAQHPQVQSTAVIVREDSPGDKRLVAYIVPQGNSPTSSELYRFLKQMLPDYMMPAVWVNLDNLPLTANGKVDYRALPVPDASLSRQGDYTPPRSELERQLVQIWSEVLNISQQIGIHDNFFELGGHSLKVTQLIFRLREVLQIELPVLRFFETPTVAELAEAIELAHQGNPISPPAKNSSIFDLAAEATLDSAIVPESTPDLPFTRPFHSFLTGATGFMGAFLLSELLQQTPGNIYCLIRANSVEAAHRKLKDNLSSYLLWDEQIGRKIIPVVGDLSQPRLGLSASKFDELAGLVDAIYHNGALVNSVLPYAQLKAANVNGTQEILRLACRQKIKPVHYISTISVFPLAIDAAETKVITEQDNPDDFATELSNGYAQSKLVADKLVRIANSRGIPISIHRLGRITGHSQTGVANTNDFLYRMIKGCIQLGSIPQRFDMVDMNPVDYVAKGIIALSLEPESLGKTFHFVNPQTIYWHQLANAIRSQGYSIAEVPEQQWREEIANLSTDATDNSLYPLLAMFSEKKPRKRSVTLEFNCQETLDSLEELSITYPSVDDSLLFTYFSYLMNSGFLEVTKSKI
ncbi:amino acid adenylation domain-containing protein [Microseira sp. BLCC-F43]|uniref:non-ribosomal peptide synthetase family protein n=1 Tax=Microseira sp. BLCC-F43 TaxID=3153602 RepID=UPI0035BB2BA3